jgi:acyl-CoA thioester hydrolase
VAEARCRYRAPARFDDDIVVRTAVVSATDRLIRFTYEVRNKRTGQLLATGETAHIVADRNLRPARLPERYWRFFAIGKASGRGGIGFRSDLAI